MRNCNFSWVTKDDKPHRVKCKHYIGHGAFHEDEEGHKIPAGMEGLMARSPEWETNDEYLEFSSSHSSNYGRDSY